MAENKITFEDLIKIPTALLLRALRSKTELEGKTAQEITELIEESVKAGREEAEGYLGKDKE